MTLATPGQAAALTRGGRAVRRRFRVVLPVLLVAAMVVGLRAFVVAPLRVSSDSMAPTLSVGATVLVDKVTLRARDAHPGDIVVIDSPDDDGLVVKRVVAVGDDVVAIRDAELFVDDVRVSEPYVDHSRIDALYFGPVTVPPGTVFVLGDNRFGSVDSRAYGPVPESDLRGLVHRS